MDLINRRLLLLALAASPVLAVSRQVHAKDSWLFRTARFAVKLAAPIRIAMTAYDVATTGYAVVGYFTRRSRPDRSSRGTGNRFSFRGTSGQTIRTARGLEISASSLRVEVKPDAVIPGRVFRIKFHSLLQNDRITLPIGGHLLLKNDGRLVFVDTAFRGWARLQYDRTLTVWSEDNEPILVVRPDTPRNNTLLLLERSPRSNQAFETLFGSPL